MGVNVEPVFPDKSAEGDAGGVGVCDGKAAGGADSGNQRNAGRVGLLHQLERNPAAQDEDAAAADPPAAIRLGAIAMIHEKAGNLRGAFAAYERLPHVVDIITNLAAEGVTRMFTAINSEMRRRQSGCGAPGRARTASVSTSARIAGW